MTTKKEIINAMYNIAQPKINKTMNRNETNLNPINFSGKEIERCETCDNDLTFEEVTEQDNDYKYCDDCFFSCCGDELDQETRICPTCKEHN